MLGDKAKPTVQGSMQASQAPPHQTRKPFLYGFHFAHEGIVMLTGKGLPQTVGSTLLELNGIACP